jgi:hypothetical protein
MKKLGSTLFLLLSLCSFSFGQYYYNPLAELNENFDVACVSASGMPTGWSAYTPTIAVSGTPSAWTCAPSEGRSATNGMSCSGTYSGVFHLDTSYLLSAYIDLYTDYHGGHVYLNFDSKASALEPNGDTIQIGITVDSTGGVGGYVNISDSTLPLFGNGDVSGWVTHQVDMTPYINTGIFRIGWRYTSKSTNGNIWYIDNVNTSRTPMGVASVANSELFFRVLGQCTSDKITIGFHGKDQGLYHLSVFNMVGQVVGKQDIMAESGRGSYDISGLDLVSGLYMVRLSDGASSATVKAVVY